MPFDAGSIRAELAAELDARGFRAFDAEIDKARAKAQRPITQQVKADVDQGSFTRATTAFRGLGDESSRLGTLLGGIGRVAGIGAIAVGAEGALQAVTALAGGLVALTSAIGAAAAGAGVLGAQGFGAIIQGAGTAKIAFDGIGDALKAYETQQKSAGVTSQRTAGQELSAAQSRQAAAQTVTSAQQGLADADRQVTVAQEQLTLAQEAGRREMLDLKRAALESGTAEKQAALNLAQAKKALQQAITTPGTSGLDLQQLQLNVLQARQAHRDSVISHTRAVHDNNVAQQQGVNGLPQVVAAQRALAAAQRQVSQASAQLAYDQKQADLHTKQAAQSMKTAAAAANQYQQALAQLTPAQRQFVKFLIPVREQLDRLRQTAAKGFFPGLEKGIKAALGNFDVLERVVARTGSTLGHISNQIGHYFGRTGVGRDFQTFANTNNKLLEDMTTGSLHLATGFRAILRAAQPFVKQMSDFTVGIAKRFEDWAKRVEHDGTLTTFFDRAGVALRRLTDIFINLGGTIAGVGKAALPLGNDILKWLRDGTKAMDDWVNSAKGQQGLATFFNTVKDSLVTLAPLAKSVFQTFGLLFGNLASDNAALKVTAGALKLIFDSFNWAVENIPGLNQVASALGAIGLSIAALRLAGQRTGIGELILGLKKIPGVAKDAVKGFGNFLGALKDAPFYARYGASVAGDWIGSFTGRVKGAASRIRGLITSALSVGQAIIAKIGARMAAVLVGEEAAGGLLGRLRGLLPRVRAFFQTMGERSGKAMEIGLILSIPLLAVAGFKLGEAIGKHFHKAIDGFIKGVVTDIEGVVNWVAAHIPVVHVGVSTTHVGPIPIPVPQVSVTWGIGTPFGPGSLAEPNAKAPKPGSNAAFQQALQTAQQRFQRGHGATGGVVTEHGIQHLQGGGTVPGGPRGTDTVPAWLTPGEGIVRAAAMKAPGVRGLVGILNALGGRPGDDQRKLELQAEQDNRDHAKRLHDDFLAGTKRTHTDVVSEQGKLVDDSKKSLGQLHDDALIKQNDLHDQTVKSWGDLHDKVLGRQNDLHDSTSKSWNDLSDRLAGTQGDIVTKTQNAFGAMANSADNKTKALTASVKGSMTSVQNAVYTGMGYIAEATTKALKALGAKPESFSVPKPGGGGAQHHAATGGRIPGYSPVDNVPIMVRGGERILRPEDQFPMADMAMRIAFGTGLDDMLQSTGGIGYKLGGFVRRFAQGGKAGDFAYPFAKSMPIGRTDEGVDAAVPGAPIGAIGRAAVTSNVNAFAPSYGTAVQGMVYKLLDGAPSGYSPSSPYVYIYEGLDKVGFGKTLAPGQLLGHIHASYPGIEMGWAAGPSGPALAHNIYTEGMETPQGKSFRRLLDDLRGGKAVSGGAAAAVARQIARVVVKGPKGPLRDLAQKVLDKTRGAAEGYIGRHAPSGVASAAQTGFIPGRGRGSVMAQIASVLRKAGLNKTAIAAVIGNAFGESSLNPASPNGLWGFFVGDKSIAAEKAYAAAHHMPWTDVATQTNFMLTTLPQSDRARLNRESLDGAVVDFLTNWEGAYPQGLANRLAGAHQAFAAGYARGGKIPGQHDPRRGVPVHPGGRGQRVGGPGVPVHPGGTGGGLPTLTGIDPFLISPTEDKIDAGTLALIASSAPELAPYLSGYQSLRSTASSIDRQMKRLWKSLGSAFGYLPGEPFDPTTLSAELPSWVTNIREARHHIHDPIFKSKGQRQKWMSGYAHRYAQAHHGHQPSDEQVKQAVKRYIADQEAKRQRALHDLETKPPPKLSQRQRDEWVHGYKRHHPHASPKAIHEAFFAYQEAQRKPRHWRAVLANYKLEKKLLQKWNALQTRAQSIIGLEGELSPVLTSTASVIRSQAPLLGSLGGFARGGRAPSLAARQVSLPKLPGIHAPHFAAGGVAPIIVHAPAPIVSVHHETHLSDPVLSALDPQIRHVAREEQRQQGERTNQLRNRGGGRRTVYSR